MSTTPITLSLSVHETRLGQWRVRLEIVDGPDSGLVLNDRQFSANRLQAAKEQVAGLERLYGTKLDVCATDQAWFRATADDLEAAR